MKKYLLLLIMAVVLGARAQTPLDAKFMNPWEACALLDYDHGSFDHYWEGTVLRTNATIGTVTRVKIMTMVAVGIIPRLNFYVGLPYVRTKSSEPNGGHLEGAKGFQDISFGLKYAALQRQLGIGKLSALASVTYSTPFTNYLSDYLPYSLGFGADEWASSGIVEYHFDMGVYVRASEGYLWRGLTKVERDYYYNNGSYYTDMMDVPSAWNMQLTGGVWLLKNSLKVEAGLTSLTSTSGDDIRKYNGAQPTNKVDFKRASLNAQYYLGKAKGTSVVAGYSRYLSGRNTGMVTNYNAGFTYVFRIRKVKTVQS